ncbi:MAG: GEVED domain-containing protein [Anaerolineae bacterium]
MCKKHFIKPIRILSVFVLFIAIMVGAVNQTEAAQPETGLQYHVCQNYDLVYVLDLSGSMGWSYNGSGSRLDAAKDAIVSMNNVLQEDAAGVQASLLTWQGSTIQVKVDFTNNFSSMNSVVNGLSASGTTPMAKAMQATRNHLQSNFDSERQQVVLFITDGIPTTDLNGHWYPDYDVNQVPIINPYGGYYSRQWVNSQGPWNSNAGARAGKPLAQAMAKIDNLTSTLPDMQMHSIAILGTDFRQDLLYYAADKGNGEYFGASNANQLAAAIQQAVYEGNCPSSLGINVDNTALFTLGGEAQTVDPNLTVTGSTGTGEAEGVSSASVQIVDAFNSGTDALYIGDSTADSGVYNGLSWWYESNSGTLEVLGIDTPEAYQDILRQVRYYNSADNTSQTNMNTRRVNFSIRSAWLNVEDNGQMSDDGFVDLEFLTGTDFGDAPASYGSAGQAADMFLRLGATVDVEGQARTSSIADGDDRHNRDDEDGITFVDGTTIYRGSVGTVDVNVTNLRQNGAMVDGWIDFNRDGQFDDATESLIGFGLTFDQSSAAQTKSDSFAIPGDASCGPTIARFRLTTEVAGPTGTSQGTGEVEDYKIDISCDPVEVPDDFDYGDAPGSYGDAQHRIIEGIQLGNSIDSEAIALNSADATGDDITGSDDEDGIVFPNGAIGHLTQTVNLNITARNSAHLDAWVSGWIDWNQDGDFNDSNEKFLTNELIPLSASDQVIQTQLSVPANAACDETMLRVRISSDPVDASENADSGEAEDIEFFVDCSVELGVKITPDMVLVPLEATLGLLVEADNTGPNIAPNNTVTVTLPVGVDLQTITPYGNWSCVAQTSDTLVVCSSPTLNITNLIQVARIEVRVPGIFPLDDVAGTAVITSEFPEVVGEEADNQDSYSVPVKKEWTGTGVPVSDMTPFSHVIYDAALDIVGDSESDFDANELVVNPIQVPVSIVPGLEALTAPQLLASFCQTHITDGCSSPEAILTGTLKLNSYMVDTFMLQTVDDSTGAPTDDAGAVDLIDVTHIITFGVSGEGRFIEPVLADCLNWSGQLGGGNCQAPYDLFSTLPSGDQAQYVWNSQEYIELIIQSNGGRAIGCSGTSGACVQITEGRPGLYRLSGVMYGEMIFNDPLYQRIGDQPYVAPFEYPFDIYINVVSTFVESEDNN